LSRAPGRGKTEKTRLELGIVMAYFLDDAVKPVGEPDSRGNPVKGESNVIEMAVVAEPVILRHPPGHSGHGIRHQGFMLAQLTVNAPNKLVLFNTRELVPVLE